MEIIYPTIGANRFYELVAKENDRPFLIVFTADWLGEGVIMDAIIELLAEEYRGAFGFYRVDIEASDKLVSHLGIGRIPAIYFFKNGELFYKTHGIISKRMLKEKIEDML